MARVMFDLDGVLRDWTGRWTYLWEKAYGEHPGETTFWGFLYVVGKSQGLDEAAMHKLLFEDWGWDITANAKPFLAAHSVVVQLQEAGHRVVIVTDQPTSQTRSGTLAWLSKHYILPDELHFTNGKHRVVADYYIEDYDHNLFMLALSRPKSTVVRMLQPWNARHDYSQFGIKTVKNLQEYAKLILEE